MKILVAVPDKMSFINSDEYALDLLSTVEALTKDPNLVDAFIKYFMSVSIKIGFEMGDIINPINSELYGLVCIEDNKLDSDAFLKSMKEVFEDLGEGEHNILVIAPNLLEKDSKYFKKEKVETITDMKDIITDLHSIYTPTSRLSVRGLEPLRSNIGFPSKGDFH
jgi:hypothetical protein